MEEPTAPSLLVATAVSLGVGLLVGVERERSKGVGPDREIAGVRTFTLAALLGLFTTILDNPAVLAALALLLGAITIAGYLRTRQSDPGVTTEIALLATFTLGALSLQRPAYSAAAGVVITVLLTSRTWLHDLATSRLSDQELHDGLLLAAAVLIVLPLLPDRTIDPWETLNPRKLWAVVVMVMAINAFGYVGLRLWGLRTGLMIAGVLGGLVSSVTTHAAMAQRAQVQPAMLTNAAAAATASSVTTALFLIGVVGTVNAPLAASLAPACIAAAIASSAAAWILHSRAATAEAGDLPLGRPLSLRAALIFGALVSAVLLASSALRHVIGPSAAVASIGAAGFADAHSGAISAALIERNGELSRSMGQIAVLLSFTANAVTKAVVSCAMGPRSYAVRIIAGLAASLTAAWATYAAGVSF